MCCKEYIKTKNEYKDIILGLAICQWHYVDNLFFNTTNKSLVKEITEASMLDAVDYGYYRQYGEVRINKEKFIEVFLRRFAESASLNSTYEISFYDIYEAPPKVSVKVSSKSNTFRIFGDSSTFDIVNKIDSVLELDPTKGLSTETESSSN